MKYLGYSVLLTVITVLASRSHATMWKNPNGLDGLFPDRAKSLFRRGNIVFGSRPYSLENSPFFSIAPQRPRYFLWNTESFLGWTSWSNCNPKTCRRFRYRKCRRNAKCPSHYLVESKICTDAPPCRDEPFNATLESQLMSNCGVRPQMMLKILGGKNAHPHSWPWQAGLIMSGHPNAVPSCGATLIGSRYVVTAAHCIVVNYWPKRLPIGKSFSLGNNIYVRLGDHHVRNQEVHEKTYSVRSIIIHPSFKLTLRTCYNDIAVIMLNDTIPLHTHVNVACVPQQNFHLPPDKKCKAVGWGVIEKKKKSFFDWFRPSKPERPDVLQEVTVPLVTHRSCVYDYPDSNLNVNTHVCAGEHGKDTCKGDSGGPLICPVDVKGKERWVLYGITSFGSHNGCGKGYGVYTRVSQFHDWIQKSKLKLTGRIRA